MIGRGTRHRKTVARDAARSPEALSVLIHSSGREGINAILAIHNVFAILGNDMTFLIQVGEDHRGRADGIVDGILVVHAVLVTAARRAVLIRSCRQRRSESRGLRAGLENSRSLRLDLALMLLLSCIGTSRDQDFNALLIVDVAFVQAFDAILKLAMLVRVDTFKLNLHVRERTFRRLAAGFSLG